MAPQGGFGHVGGKALIVSYLHLGSQPDLLETCAAGRRIVLGSQPASAATRPFFLATDRHRIALEVSELCGRWLHNSGRHRRDGRVSLLFPTSCSTSNDRGAKLCSARRITPEESRGECRQALCFEDLRRAERRSRRYYAATGRIIYC